jgi:DNA-binding GntR family transcriptional regulator
VFTLTAVTGQPAYRRIADDLRSKILDGTYPVGDPLPSTTNLMATYEVSVTVARAAVNELRTEGVVAGQPGKGVYVLKAPGAPSTSSTDAAVLARALEDMGRTVKRLEERVSALEASQPESGTRPPGQ